MILQNFPQLFPPLRNLRVTLSVDYFTLSRSEYLRWLFLSDPSGFYFTFLGGPQLFPSLSPPLLPPQEDRHYLNVYSISN
jgi:hypothetical protein